MTEDGLTVGELAAASGLTVRTLHHYDRIGLLTPSGRTSGGHRRYADGDVVRLYRIVALRQLRVSLAEIRAALTDEQPIGELLQRQLLETSRSIQAHHELLARLKRGIAASELPVEELFDVIGGTLEVVLGEPEGAYRPRDATAAAIISTIVDGLDSGHAALRRRLEELTHDELGQPPLGRARPIGDSLLRALTFEDRYVQEVVQVKPTVYDSQGWSACLGLGGVDYLTTLPPTVNLGALRGYADAVFAATTAYVSDITEDELNRDIPGPGASALTWSMKVSELLVQVVAHTLRQTAYTRAIRDVAQPSHTRL